MKDMYTQLKFMLIALLITSITTNYAQNNRPIDGYGTNKLYKDWGSTNALTLTVTPVSFSDGISEPAGYDRPNPRVISNMIFAQEGLINDPMGLSDFAWAWGQFIDHDITLSGEDHEQPMSIPIPKGDIHFDPYNTGEVSLHTVRSVYDHNTGTSVDNPRRFPNGITAFIDASAVYGSDGFRANQLRTFRHGI